MHSLARALRHASRAASLPRRVPAHRAAQAGVSRRFASSTTPYSTTQDPAEAEAFQCLEQGTQKLEEGDIKSARALYRRSVQIRPTAGALFNLGVASYHLREFAEAIDAWQQSIAIQPTADAHTNLASAYIIGPEPRPQLALHHLEIAISLAPDDPEIMFNLAAVLEASGNLQDALKYYKQSKDHGVDKAAVHVRNVSAKIIGQQMLELERQQQEQQQQEPEPELELEPEPEPAPEPEPEQQQEPVEGAKA